MRSRSPDRGGCSLNVRYTKLTSRSRGRNSLPKTAWYVRFAAKARAIASTLRIGLSHRLGCAVGCFTYCLEIQVCHKSGPDQLMESNCRESLEQNLCSTAVRNFYRTINTFEVTGWPDHLIACNSCSSVAKHSDSFAVRQII